MRIRTFVPIAALALQPWAWAQYDITWDGGPTGTGANWNLPENWNPDTIPTLADEATFTNTGLSAGKIISLDANQGVATLTLTTGISFTIGSAADLTAGRVLTLTDVTRLPAASGTQTFAAPLVLAADSTWDVAGSGAVVAGKVTGTAGLTKRGAGELRFSGAQSAYQRSGPTTVGEGTLAVTNAKQIGSGALTVGDGVHAAAFRLCWTYDWSVDAIGDTAPVTVQGSGVFDLETGYTAAGSISETTGSLTVEAGGLAKLGKVKLFPGGDAGSRVTLRGGAITGSGTAGYLAPRSGTILVDAAATEKAVIGARIAVQEQYDNGNVFTKFNVNDAAGLPVELEVSGAMVNAANNKDGFDKLGSGVMRVTGSNSYGGYSTTEGATRVQAGTLLVDNAAGAGLGNSHVTVGGGATLGGTGTLGGLAGAVNANLALAGSSTASLATLAPGTLNETDGHHVIGTLTLGGAAQSNTATFGTYSRLLINLGTAANGDKLVISGDLNLAAGGNQLTILSPSDAMSGTYALASFSGTLTGRFGAATVNGASPFPSGYELQYRDSSNQAVSGTGAITNGTVVLTVDSGSWTTVPLGGGGCVDGLVAGPAGDIYCRSDVGGAFRWNAAAGSWVSITDTIVSPTTLNCASLTGIAGIAADPNNADQLYVAAGETPSSPLHGIFSSTDRGATWTQINAAVVVNGNGAPKNTGERLQVDPNNSNILWYGSSQDGLQKGLRASGSWTWTQIPAAAVPFGTVAAGDKFGVTFVACDRNGGGTIVYAGVYDTTGTSGGGVYRSTDTGATWSLVGGVALPRPVRAQVAANGTLYVTHTALVAKMARGGSFVAVTPTSDANINYYGVAVDPNDAAGNTVYVAQFSANSYSKIWRSADGGASWARQSTNFNNGVRTRVEPDGTPSLTGYWFGGIASLLVNPANSGELWLSDSFGVSRTQNASLIGTSSGAFWNLLQKGQEETCVEALKSAPTGPRLMVGVADVGGFRYLDSSNRPYGSYGNVLANPAGGSTVGLDFCEGSPNVWARTWVNGPHTGGTGATSLDGGATWLVFGQIAGSTVTNSVAGGWEGWDLSPFVSRQKARGATAVTVAVLNKDATNYSTAGLSFDSREAADSAVRPSLLLNGSTSLTPVADSHVYGYTPSTNYGTGTSLVSSYSYGKVEANRWIYLKFDLSGVGAISSASLRLHRQSSTNTVQFPVCIYACTNTSWNESTLTWANKPDVLGGTSEPVGDPRYYDGATLLNGGRIAVSATNPNNFVWLPLGTSNAPRYSLDRGVTWSACTGAPNSQSTTQFYPSVLINQLAADRVNGKFYLAAFGVVSGGNHRIYASTDGGATWAVTSTLAAASFNVYRAQIQAAPAANDVWVCDDGVEDPAKGGLWRSTDGGVTWSARLTGIRAVRQVTFGKAQSGSGYTVFINGYKDGIPGIYRSDDSGGSWTRLRTVPTVQRIDALAGDRQNYGRVFIGTGGRGTFSGF